MGELVSFNGEMVKADDARIVAVSSAALYGRGVFTTVAINDGEPFLWEKHWQRLTKNAYTLGIDISAHSETAVRSSLKQTFAAYAAKTGRARITFFDESAGGIWRFNTHRKTSVLITTAKLRTKTGPLRLTLSPYTINSRSPLAGIKSCNYLENVLALNTAKESGFDEAIRLNEKGTVTSACMANVFWLKDDTLYTPPLSTGCLAGTTREFILERFDCVETEAGMDAIADANAVFLTSAGLDVIEAAEFNGRTFGSSGHAILQAVPPAA